MEKPLTPTAKRILIVEDDVALSRLYEKKFTQEGFLVTVVHAGDEALKKVMDLHPDFILLDMMLPKFTGDKIMTFLVADPATAKIPVIILSNNADQVSADKVLALGAKEYLVKAMHTPEEIVLKVKKYL